MVPHDRKGLNDDISAIIRKLACYLGKHPNACDTLPGIERWWLGPHMSVRHSDLALALQWLEQSGLMQRTAAADGRVRYGRAGAGATDNTSAAANFESRVLALLANTAAPR